MFCIHASAQCYWTQPCCFSMLLENIGEELDAIWETPLSSTSQTFASTLPQNLCSHTHSHTHTFSLSSQTLWGPLGICGFAIEWLNVSMATIALNYRRCPKGCRHNWVPPGAKRSSAHSSEIRCLYFRKPPGGRQTHSLLSDLKNPTAQWEHQSSPDQIKASSNKFYCNWDQPQLDTL